MVNVIQFTRKLQVVREYIGGPIPARTRWMMMSLHQ